LLVVVTDATVGLRDMFTGEDGAVAGDAARCGTVIP